MQNGRDSVVRRTWLTVAEVGARGRRGGDLRQRGGKDPILPQSLGAGPQLCQHLGFGLLTPRTVR